jgi:hypothetical protein
MAVSLKDVGQKALQDPRFFQALVKNPDATLKQYRVDLSPQDQDFLTRVLQERPVRGRFNLVEFINGVHKLRASRLFANWDSDWLNAWLERPRR